MSRSTKTVSKTDEWLTLEEAAKRLKMAERTVTQRGKDGILKRNEEVSSAGRTTYRYSAQGVADLIAAREELAKSREDRATNRAVRVTRAAPAPVVTAPPPPVAPDILADAVRASSAKLGDHIWLTVDEAASYVRLPRTWLEHMIRVGKLPAMDTHQRDGGKWRVQVGDLEDISAERQSLARSA